MVAAADVQLDCKQIDSSQKLQTIQFDQSKKANVFYDFDLSEDQANEQSLLLSAEAKEHIQRTIDLPKIVAAKQVDRPGVYAMISDAGSEVMRLSAPSYNIYNSTIFYGKFNNQSLACSTNKALNPAAPATAMDDLCRRLKSPAILLNILRNTDNRLSFINPKAGFLNGGVCWWISRFERNATYLTIFQPGKNKPNYGQAQQLIAQIIAGNNIVVINGFRSLSDFSRQYRKEIIDQLASWQTSDTLAANWTYGLGENQMGAAQLAQQMDDIFRNFQRMKNLQLVLLKFPGFESRSWLLLDMKRVSNGYQLDVADSNFLKTNQYIYTRGTTHLNYLGFENSGNYSQREISIIPYIHHPAFDNEEFRVRNILKRACKIP